MRTALFFAIGACAIVACSTESAPNGDTPATANADAGADGATTDAPSPPRGKLPYPSGPYGAAIGDVLADFHVIGYATSREHRDIASLPFRDITLAEVRSDPKCACLVVVWSTAGLTCVPSIEGRTAIATIVSSDESVCAVDVIWDTLDAGPPFFDGESFRPAPPTRADLDAIAEGLHPPFPMGLATDDAVQSLGTNPVPGLPDFFVVRTSDMRIADVVYGVDPDLRARIHRTCASPRPAVETLAKDLAPTALVLDDNHAFVADAKGRIVRVARGGGSALELAQTPAPADALAVDGSKVYWSEPTVLATAAKDGGGRTVLATLASRTRSIATDGTHVYLAHVDGSIGAVPVAGGSETVLLSGEAGPSSLLVDATQIYWLAAETGAVFAAAKDGSARTTLIEADGRRRGQILFTGDRVMAREQDNFSEQNGVLKGDQNTFSTVTKSGTERETYNSDYGMIVGASWDAVADRVDIVNRGGDRARGDNDAALSSFSTTPRELDGRRAPEFVTLGQHHLTGIASGGDGYVYWTTNEPSGGALRRIKR